VSVQWRHSVSLHACSWSENLYSDMLSPTPGVVQIHHHNGADAHVPRTRKKSEAQMQMLPILSILWRFVRGFHLPRRSQIRTLWWV
jgi:hypothetical protein